MKIIDLLVKISKGEEVPKKVLYHNDIHELQKNNNSKPLNCYYSKKGHCHLFGSYYNYDLNDEIEIIEEPKKIENLEPIYKLEQDMKLDSVIAWQKANNKMFENKLNEIIDYINDKENK